MKQTLLLQNTEIFNLYDFFDGLWLIRNDFECLLREARNIVR